jgi:hypothetical protein
LVGQRRSISEYHEWTGAEVPPFRRTERLGNLTIHRQKELKLNVVRVPKCEAGPVWSIQDLTVLDTQGIETCWPGFEFFSTGATKGDVVESNPKFIEHVAFKLMLIFVDCEHWLRPERRSKTVILDDANRRRPEEAFVPLDTSLEIGNCQGVMVESRE